MSPGDIGGLVRLTRKVVPGREATDVGGWAEINSLRDTKEDYDDVLVLIHGTYAGCESSNGSNWWQSDGAFHKEIKAPRRFIVHFQWSGENDEYVRRQAGFRLWLLLIQLEAVKLPYRIVAHSHGGSLLWHALTFSVVWHSEDVAVHRLTRSGYISRKDPVLGPVQHQCVLINPPRELKLYYPLPQFKGFECLPSLKSCVTVGTPYLTYKPKASWISAIYVLSRAIEVVLVFVVASIANSRGWPLGLAYFIAGLVLFLLFDQFIVNSLDIAQRQAKWTRILNSCGIRAWELFKGRYKTVWSKDDETVNGISASLYLDGPVLPRFAQAEASDKVAGPVMKELARMDRQGHQSKSIALTHWGELFQQWKAGIHNRFTLLFLHVVDATLVRIADVIIKARIRFEAFGYKYAGGTCEKVSSVPHVAPVQEPLEQDGIDVAFTINEKSRDLMEHTRLLLRNASTEGIRAIRFDREKLFAQVIHNSYFNSEAVRRNIREKLGLQ